MERVGGSGSVCYAKSVRRKWWEDRWVEGFHSCRVEDRRYEWEDVIRQGTVFLFVWVVILMCGTWDGDETKRRNRRKQTYENLVTK